LGRREIYSEKFGGYNLEDTMKGLRTFHAGVAGIAMMLFVFLAVSESQAKKRTRKGYLGVFVERLSLEERKELDVPHGVRVTGVEEGSPAEKGDLKEDDIILEFNGEKITHPDDLVEVVRKTPPKTEARIAIQRDGKRETLTVTVGRYSSSAITVHTVPGGEKKIFRVFRGSGAYLGVRLQEMSSDLADYFGVKAGEGALILSVEEDSPAEKDGLKAGDVIVQIDGEAVAAPEDVSDILADFEEEDEVEVAVIRKSRKESFQVTLGERPGLSGLRIWKGFFDRDGEDLKGFHLQIPDIPEIDIHVPHFEEYEDIREDFRLDLREKLKGLNERVRKGVRKVREIHSV
jgi:C-terminal processing protease CtpA/Prc